MAHVAAEAGERRRASKMAAILRGMAMAAVAGHALEAAGPLRVNAGRRGAPFTISDVLIAELAVARDTRHMPCLEPGGYVQKITNWRCTITAPQLCRRTSAPGIREVDGVLRVGESGVLAGERGGVRRSARGAGAAPRRTGARQSRTAAAWP